MKVTLPIDLSQTLWRTKEICNFLRIGRNMLTSIANEPSFPRCFYIGKTRLWRSDDIKRWADKLADEAQQEPAEKDIADAQK